MLSGSINIRLVNYITCTTRNLFSVKDLLRSEPYSMILYDCVIFTLVSLHVTHYLIFQFAEVIFERLIECRDFFLEVTTCQLVMSEPILNVTESECGIGSFEYHTPIPG